MIDPQAGPVPAQGMVRRPLWRDLPVVIIVITGLFHLGRGAPVDGVIFLAIGGGLIVAELRDRRMSRVPVAAGAGRPLGMRWVVLAALGCVAYGTVVGSWAPGSVPVVLAVVLPGLLILPLAWRVGPPSRAERAGAGRWVWAGVMLLVCLWELNSFLRQPDAKTASYDHPTLSAILNPLFESPAVRSVLLVVWLAVGLWLARRLSTAPDRGEQT